MKKISVLDCTLRDGGYCNDWQFGKENTGRIVSLLADSGVDIIECGFLTEKVIHTDDTTRFNNLDQVEDLIPKSHKKNMFVMMMNCDEFDVSHLPPHSLCSNTVDGIRVAFHKKDIDYALKICEQIKEKGYMVFLQPMVSLSYTDEEFLSLIKKVNRLVPYAFYIVDSFGAMKQRDMIRLFYMVEHNLNKDICIGFHSHNNMQLSFSNAQTLVDIQTHHKLIIDSCVYGMGRGAGNLNTEILIEYLNDITGSGYNIKPLLTIIDEILDPFYKKATWGFSLPAYLSAIHNTHPNYARYLNEKYTLTVEGISDIFDMMDDEKRIYYDEHYIEDLYLRYLSRGTVQAERKDDFIKIIKEKKILVIAPGKSVYDERKEIVEYAKRKDVISISINFDYDYCTVDYIFVSNQRRFKDIPKKAYKKCIVTSNIPANGIYMQTSYKELLNNHSVVQDNAGLLVIKFLMICGVDEIYIAGMDGYSHDVFNNFGDNRLGYIARTGFLDEMNKGITGVLNEYAKDIKIHFLTQQRYIRLYE